MIVPFVTRPSRTVLKGFVPETAFAPPIVGRAVATLFDESVTFEVVAADATPNDPTVIAATSPLATSDDFLLSFIGSLSYYVVRDALTSRYP